MIGDVLSLLRDQLDAFLRAAAPALDENPADARVQLPDGAKADPIEFRLNAITLLLVNIEQETGLRSADPYLRAPGASCSPRSRSTCGCWRWRASRSTSRG